MASPAFVSVDRNLLRQSLRLGVSILITCAIAQHFQRITYLWYPLLAVNPVSYTHLTLPTILLV